MIAKRKQHPSRPTGPQVLKKSPARTFAGLPGSGAGTTFGWDHRSQHAGVGAAREWELVA